MTYTAASERRVTLVPNMPNRRTKGTNIANIAKFIDERYSHSDRQKIHAALSDEVKSTLRAIDASEWYSVEIENSLHRAMGSVAESDEQAEQKRRELGQYLFDAALGTFMRLVLRVLTPAMFFKKTKDIWPRMFDFGSFEAEAVMESNKAIMIMRGIQGLDYMADVSAGFIEQAVKTIGYANVDVTVEPIAGEPEGNHHFHVRWS